MEETETEVGIEGDEEPGSGATEVWEVDVSDPGHEAHLASS